MSFKNLKLVDAFTAYRRIEDIYALGYWENPRSIDVNVNSFGLIEYLTKDTSGYDFQLRIILAQIMICNRFIFELYKYKVEVEDDPYVSKDISIDNNSNNYGISNICGNHVDPISLIELTSFLQVKDRFFSIKSMILHDNCDNDMCCDIDILLELSLIMNKPYYDLHVWFMAFRYISSKLVDHIKECQRIESENPDPPIH